MPGVFFSTFGLVGRFGLGWAGRCSLALGLVELRPSARPATPELARLDYKCLVYFSLLLGWLAVSVTAGRRRWLLTHQSVV